MTHTFMRLCLLIGSVGIYVPVGAVQLGGPHIGKAGETRPVSTAHGDEIVVTGKPRRVAPPYRTMIDDVYNVIGFAGAKPNAGGRLAFTDRGIDFVSGKATYGVAFEAVRTFAIEHTNKGLMRGTKGMVASFAPQGIGQVYSLFRPGAAMLTLTYSDTDGGLHGAVLILPEKQTEEVVRALTAAGVPDDVVYPDADQSKWRADRSTSAKHGKVAMLTELQVRMPTATVEIPFAYRVVTYEAMLERLTNRTGALMVRRDGDCRSGRDTYRLATTIIRFDKGNAGLRGAVPIVGSFAGKTRIDATIVLSDGDGTVMFTDKVRGARMLPGESTGATIGLAKQIAKRVEQADLDPITHLASR